MSELDYRIIETIKVIFVTNVVKYIKGYIIHNTDNGSKDTNTINKNIKAMIKFIIKLNTN